jgi:hypothetical protein
VDLGLAGRTVLGWKPGYVLTLHTDRDTAIQIEQPATATRGAAEQVIVPGPDARLPDWPAGAVIAAATAGPAGTLHLRFTDGSAPRVPAHPRYEAWNVSGPGILFVCAPGGEVCRW